MRTRAGLGLELGLLAGAAVFLWVGYGAPGPSRSGFRLAEKPADALRVVTWNVGGSGADGGVALRDEHVDHVVDVLTRLEPDVCLLQEVSDEAQRRRLRSRLGPAWSGLGAGGRPEVAILAHGGGLERFFVPGDRGRALGVIYRVRERPPLAIVDLHADAFSSRRRNRQIGRAAEALLDRAPAAAKLLGGDFNLDVDPGRRRDLFTDDQHLDVETYNFVAQRLLDAARRGGSTAEPDRRLDYLFVTEDHLDVLTAGPWKGQRVGDMDHDPVVADLRFRP